MAHTTSRTRQQRKVLCTLSLHRSHYCIIEPNTNYRYFVLGYGSSRYYHFFFFNDTAPPKIYPLPLPDALPISGPAEAALKALERLGYGTAEADRALRDVLAADGGGSTETLVRRALHLLTGG